MSEIDPDLPIDEQAQKFVILAAINPADKRPYPVKIDPATGLLVNTEMGPITLGAVIIEDAITSDKMKVEGDGSIYANVEGFVGITSVDQNELCNSEINLGSGATYVSSLITNEEMKILCGGVFSDQDGTIKITQTLKTNDIVNTIEDEFPVTANAKDGGFSVDNIGLQGRLSFKNDSGSTTTILRIYAKWRVL